MNFKILKIAAFLTFCLLISGIATASTIIQVKNGTTKDTQGPIQTNITSIIPTSGKTGQTVAFNITGSGFLAGTKIYLEKVEHKATKVIYAISVNVTPSRISGKFDIPKDAAAGAWNITSKYDSLISNSKVPFTITA